MIKVDNSASMNWDSPEKGGNHTDYERGLKDIQSSFEEKLLDQNFDTLFVLFWMDGEVDFMGDLMRSYQYFIADWFGVVDDFDW